jgi:hypothetical protein
MSTRPEKRIYILPPTAYDSCRGIDSLHPSGKVVAEVRVEHWNVEVYVRPAVYHLCSACLQELVKRAYCGSHRGGCLDHQVYVKDMR